MISYDDHGGAYNFFRYPNTSFYLPDDFILFFCPSLGVNTWLPRANLPSSIETPSSFDGILLDHSLKTLDVQVEAYQRWKMQYREPSEAYSFVEAWIENVVPNRIVPIPGLVPLGNILQNRHPS